MNLDFDRSGWDDIKPVYQYSDLAGNPMMLTTAEAPQTIEAKPYNVNDMALDQSELGAEAMPAQLIQQPITVGKKWMILGLLVVVVAIGYFIYKQSKKHNKKRF